MSIKDEENQLPEVENVPLIIDVDFVEEEDINQSFNDLNEVTSQKTSRPLDLPFPSPTRDGLARVITVINQKGGVGKTTTVINIASQLALRGHRILVVDADSQGNCATGLGVDKSKVKHTTRDLILSPETAVTSRHATAVDGLHMIVGDRSLVGLEQEMLRQLGRERRLAEALEPLLPHYDIVIIDTPPSLGLVTINALVASDGVLIPVQTEYFALEGLAMLAGTLREVRNLLNQQVASEILEHLPEFVIHPAIRRNIKLAEAPSHGVPIHLHDPNSNGGQDYQGVSDTLEKRWGLI